MRVDPQPLTSGAFGFRLSSKPLLTSDAYELGTGVRKRHKGSEEEHEALVGTGKARGRNQPWDEHEASSDFMSQVSNLILGGGVDFALPLWVPWPSCCIGTVEMVASVPA